MSLLSLTSQMTPQPQPQNRQTAVNFWPSACAPPWAEPLAHPTSDDKVPAAAALASATAVALTNCRLVMSMTSLLFLPLLSVAGSSPGTLSAVLRLARAVGPSTLRPPVLLKSRRSPSSPRSASHMMRMAVRGSPTTQRSTHNPHPTHASCTMAGANTEWMASPSRMR